MVAQVGLLLIETVSLCKMQYQVAQNENSDLLMDNMLQFCRFSIYLFFCCLQIRKRFYGFRYGVEPDGRF